MKRSIVLLQKTISIPLAIVELLFAIVFTNILGLLCAIPVIGTFLLLALSVVWWILYLPVKFCFYVSETISFLFLPVSVFCVPWAILSHFIVALFPSFGENKAKNIKLLMLEVWPYTNDLNSYIKNRENATAEFYEISLLFKIDEVLSIPDKR